MAIPDIGVSRAAYRTLSAPGQVDVYEFSAKKGQEIYIQMTVPLLDRERDFAPEFSLVFMGDPGTAFGDAEVIKGARGDTPPADGTYRIGVYTRDGSMGKYVLAPGKREQFGLGDIFSLPSIIIDVRTFCEVPVWPDYLLFTTLGIFSLVAQLASLPFFFVTRRIMKGKA
jgi:hypothetical protein